MNEVIILTRMYVGSYLQSNIGHEVINLFRDDKGDNYIYVNEDGRINPKYDNAVRAVILVKYAEPGVMEVIAKAEELTQVFYKTKDADADTEKQVAYVKDHGITYGGVFPYEVHQSNMRAIGDYSDPGYAKNVITFKCNHLRKVKKPFYLIEDKEKTYAYENYIILPEKHFSKQSLKMYYPKSEFKKDYKILVDALSNDDIWEEENTTKRVDIGDYGDSRPYNTFLSVIRKEYDELVFSNLLAYIFEENKRVFVDFVKQVLGVDDFGLDFEIIRESNNNIDLWIEGENSVIVIENKIKSKINGERHDIYSDLVQSQLSKYYQYAHDERPGKDIHCFIFSPDYNMINLDKYKAGKYYNLVNYSQIYNFYLDNAGRMIHTEYFREFIDAVYLHSNTVDNSNFETMKQRFIEAIRRIVNNE